MAGVAGNLTVTAKDAAGNTITDYVGTVTLSSSDGSSTLPVPYTFLVGDNGSPTFTGEITLTTAGDRSIRGRHPRQRYPAHRRCHRYAGGITVTPAAWTPRRARPTVNVVTAPSRSRDWDDGSGSPASCCGSDNNVTSSGGTVTIFSTLGTVRRREVADHLNGTPTARRPSRPERPGSAVITARLDDVLDFRRWRAVTPQRRRPKGAPHRSGNTRRSASVSPSITTDGSTLITVRLKDTLGATT